MRVRVPGCTECDRLWSLYNAVRAGQVSLEHRLKLLELRQSGTAIEEARIAVEQARRDSDSPRTAIAEHEATHEE